MKKYQCHKIVQAEPMNLGEYNKFKCWTIPEDEDPEREGYKVVYHGLQKNSSKMVIMK
jgi:hypothetical protein